MGPTEYPIRWRPGAFSIWVKQPGHKPDHHPSSSASALVHLHDVYRDNFMFVFTADRQTMCHYTQFYNRAGSTVIRLWAAQTRNHIFNSQQHEKDFFLFLKESGLTLGSTQTHIQMVSVALPWRLCGQGMKPTTHMHLLSKIQNVWRSTSSPHNSALFSTGISKPCALPLLITSSDGILLCSNKFICVTNLH